MMYFEQVTWKRLRLRGPLFRPVDFIAQNPVFRLEEFVAAHRDMDRPSRSAAEELKYHVETGRLVNLRRGLYAHTATFDPWLIASRMAHDAVISHDGALSFHGVTGVGHRVTFTTRTRTPAMTFNEIVFDPIRTSNLKQGDEVQRGAHRLKVTSLSIAFTDCLIDLERSPPAHELYELLAKSARSLDPAVMIAHALETKSRLAISRLAFFLWCARCPLEREQTWDLEHHGVRKPTYFQRSARTDRDSNIPRWNLIVSPELQLVVPRN
jgi:hypothetical protein